MITMRLSEISGKEIVDVNRAERLGILGQTDLEINKVTGEIIALIIPMNKWLPFKKSSGNEIRVPWHYIRKIGEEMIIIEVVDDNLS